MKHENKTETLILDGSIREIYDYIEVGEKKIKHGFCKEYDYDGTLKSECSFKMGIKCGLSKEYSEGELKAEGNYKDGKKDGLWTIKDVLKKERKAIFIEGIEQKEDIETKKYKNIFFSFTKLSLVEILASFGMIAIILTCIIQLGILTKEFTPEKKENNYVAEEIFDFPEKYEPITEK